MKRPEGFLEKPFEGNVPLTIGVEEEYQLCDSVTGDLVQRVNDVFAAADEDFRPRLSYELLLSVLEARTGINETVDDAVEEVAGMRRKCRDLCAGLGIRLGISGAHPFGRWRDQEFVDNPDYRWVREQLHYFARRNITFGLQVHIGLDDAEEVVYVTNCVRKWVAPLLALSANSPFFDEASTGYSSVRTALFGAFPRTGLPPRFSSYHEYEVLIEKMIQAGTIVKPRHIWWKVRPHTLYGTIEFRMCDVQRSLGRTRFFIAICQALVGRLADDCEAGAPEPPLSAEFLLDALWKASRYGLDAKVVEPETSEVLSMREMVVRMLDCARPKAEELGTASYIDEGEAILNGGTEADEQMRVFDDNGQDLRRLQQRLMAQVEYEVR